jgi:hypothetical protein
MTERRRFIATASGVVATVAAATIIDAPNVIAQPKVQWRMSTTWTPALDTLQGAAERLAKVAEEMSGGRFRIEVFPGGQIMPRPWLLSCGLIGSARCRPSLLFLDHVNELSCRRCNVTLSATCQSSTPLRERR